MEVNLTDFISFLLIKPIFVSNYSVIAQILISSPTILDQLKNLNIMKQFFLLLLSVCLSFAAQADFIQLTNGDLFEGKVLKVYEGELLFKTEAGTYFIPQQDLQCVNLDHRSKRKEKALDDMFATPAEDTCSRGSVAGGMHGHGFGQFCAGFFGSLIGVGIVMIVDKTPSKSKNLLMVADDRDVWTDPSYLACYDKAAKKKALTNSGLGMLTYVVLYLASY